MKKDLSQNILNKIKKENIKPIPKIVFVIIFVLKLFGIILLSLITSLIFSILIFHFANIETVFFDKIGILKTLEILLPFYWLLIVLISIGFTYYIFYKFLNGYRYKFGLIIILNFFIYSILGIMFFQFNVPDYFEKVAISNLKDEKLKDFLSLEYRLKKVWQNPQEGMLGGKIIKLYKDKMLIEDFKGERWIVEFYKGTLIDKKILEHNVKKVKIEGILKNNTIFIATKIRPFGVKNLIDKLYNEGNKTDISNKTIRNNTTNKKEIIPNLK